MRPISRRGFLQVGGATAALVLAGCAGDDDRSVWLMYYASDDEREEWRLEEGRELPPRLVPPYPRAMPAAPA